MSSKTDRPDALAATEADPALAATAKPDVAVTPGALLDGTLTDPGTRSARARRVSGLSGDQLAHYQLEEEIGRGGMGIVYRARDLALDRPVAVKVLSDEFAGPADRRDRFYREARAQARINHPNVCHIYYVGEERERLFFAMELVDGRSVSELLEEDGKLGAPRALEIVRQAALGLREAHRHGIVHRDIKPSNLMIDRHGVVKVMDFGIAKQGEQPAADATHMATVEQTTIAGTPLFAAPEQLKGDAIDHRADIYALGATLHQLLTGSAPFVADSVEALTQLHATESRPQFERRVIGKRDLALLNELTDRMMAKKPADRFEDYDSLLTAIEFAEPSSSRPAGFGIRALSVAIDMMVASLLQIPLSLIHDNLGNAAVFGLIMMLYSGVMLARRGTTVGRWMLGIEVTGGTPGRGIGTRSAISRCLAEFGPAMLVIGVIVLAGKLLLRDVEVFAIFALVGVVAINVLHVALTSMRSDAARTFWDRRAGTQVRYLRVRGSGASDAE